MPQISNRHPIVQQNIFLLDFESFSCLPRSVFYTGELLLQDPTEKELSLAQRKTLQVGHRRLLDFCYLKTPKQ